MYRWRVVSILIEISLSSCCFWQYKGISIKVLGILWFYECIKTFKNELIYKLVTYLVKADLELEQNSGGG